jgi:hypothetical protein
VIVVSWVEIPFTDAGSGVVPSPTTSGVLALPRLEALACRCEGNAEKAEDSRRKLPDARKGIVTANLLAKNKAR